MTPESASLIAVFAMERITTLPLDERPDLLDTLAEMLKPFQGFEEKIDALSGAATAIRECEQSQLLLEQLFQSPHNSTTP